MQNYYAITVKRILNINWFSKIYTSTDNITITHNNNSCWFLTDNINEYLYKKNCYYLMHFNFLTVIYTQKINKNK